MTSPAVATEIAEVGAGLVALGRPGRRGHERIDGERVRRATVLDEDRELLPVEVQSRGNLVTCGVPDVQLAVAEHPRPALVEEIHRSLLRPQLGAERAREPPRKAQRAVARPVEHGR